MTTTKQYDHLNRLSLISSVPSGASPVNFNYSYNAANQRMRSSLANGSYWTYNYDALGQVTSGMKYWSDGTPVAGEQFGYAFDIIGNRESALTGGDQHGGYLRQADYANNALNQITSRSVPGYLDIKGVSLATDTVTVASQPAYRKGEYFRQELPVNNSAAALWSNVTVLASGQGGVTGNLFVSQTPETMSYDADGNLIQDGRWSYTWDGENRLINMTSLSGSPAGSQFKLSFVYDYLGRRIQKLVMTNNAGSYVGDYTNRWLYDGWNPLVEVAPNGSLIRSYLWGADLSGSAQGAGGVGGLLAENIAGNGVQFLCYDGNGNVVAMVNASGGAVSAQYEYGPFGEVIRATGPMAKLNPIRFSTKYDDDESDLIMYPYRPYSASTGRWLSRDPIQELSFYSLSVESEISEDNDLADSTANILGDGDGDSSLNLIAGGPNVYAFVQNNPVNSIDDLGLTVYLQAHPVDLGFNHSYVLMVVGCGSEWFGSPHFAGNPMPGEPGEEYATIGAGPSLLFTGLLKSGVDRKTDMMLGRAIFSVTISPPAGVSDDDFIDQLFATDFKYPNSHIVPYALFPTRIGPSYNSNSYASGILLFVTGSMPPRPPHTPGFKKPVPARDF